MKRVLSSTIQSLFQPYKGILAADERPSSMDKRLASYGIPCGAAMRARCREILFSTPNLERTISGIILAENTFRDHETGGVRTKDFLHSLGIVVGVKVDDGLVPFDGGANLSVTAGLDSLADKCRMYASDGALFLKWRSAVPVLPPVPDSFLRRIADDSATYARCALDNGLVPVIEPEVLLKGNHTTDESAALLKRVIGTTLTALREKGCDPRSCVLKTSFAAAGLSAPSPAVDTVVKETLTALREAKADRFAGIVFLSGGLPSEDAIAYIQRIRAVGERADTPHSFSQPMTFSYARALQESMLTAWQGKEENVLAAQVAFTQTLQHAVKKYKGSEEAPLGGNGKDV